MSVDNIDVGCIASWFIEQYIENAKFYPTHISFTLLHRPHYAELITDLVGTKVLKKISGIAQVTVSKKSNILSLCWNVSDKPKVSLIIPTKNAKDLVQKCIESILQKTSYQNFEILLVDNNSDEKESLDYFSELSQNDKIRVLKYPHEFNYSAINNFAVKYANGSIIGLVNNDIEVIDHNWLRYMVGHVCRKDVGCVGAKLLYPNKLIQHAGVVMGYGGGAGHAHKFFPCDHDGYLARLVATNNFSAVTAACLLIKKSDFLEVGGLNERELKVAFNDVDLCLRVALSNKRNVYCAEAILFHHESVSRGHEDTPEKQHRFAGEVDYIQNTWNEIIEKDPAYNRHLTLSYEDFSIRS
nr:glycosyltransferase [Neptunicella marina]